MVKCSVCGFDNKPDAKFCMNCGSPIDHQKVSHAMDDVSEEKTVLLDPAAMQARVAEEIKKDKPAGPPSAPAQPMMAAPPPMQAAPPPPPMQPMGGAPPPPRPMQPMAPPPMAPPPMGAPQMAPPPQMMGGQPGMGMQPPMMGGGTGAPNNSTMLLVLSILETLCCCLPLGIAGIVFSVQAKGAYDRGDFGEGEAKSKQAKMMLLIGLIVGLIINGIYAALQVIAVMGSSGSY